MMTQQRERYAQMFGLPVEQIRLFNELTPTQKNSVNWLFSLANTNQYVYAVKKDGSLVSKREKLKEV